ncbi:uncharacterized protein LOC120014492 [Tripterygium wilfordii]|nr:uncharacterized protein LOC120014492 [Tripterygium wilfordii]
MALVDYAISSDDDDVSEAEEEPTPPKRQASPPIRPDSQQKSEEPSSSETAPEPLQLPDASFLLNEHGSKKKRDSNGLSSSQLPRSKVPRGTLLHTRNLPDTGGGMLVPPQLSGRKNVVTEDIGKLFVKRRTDDSSH